MDDSNRDNQLEDSALSPISKEQWAEVRRRVAELDAHPGTALTWEEVQAKLKDLRSNIQ